MVKIITNFGVLLRLAKSLGKAEMALKENPFDDQLKKVYEEAKKAHDSYRDLCLTSDGMSI